MKEFFIVVFAFLLSLPFFSIKAEAHVLQTDKTIGAILHIDPDDDPAANQQSNFFLEFKDQKNKFSLSTCNCLVTIKEEGRIITTLPITSTDSETTGMFSFTFPQKDVYSIIVTGKPATDTAFQPFQLTYDVRVAKEANTTPPTSNFFSDHLISLLGVAIAGIAGAIYLFNRKK